MARGREQAAVLNAPVEGPWELPEGWRWLPFSELGSWGSGGTPDAKNSAYYGGDIDWFRSGELNDGYLSNSEIKITEDGFQNSSAKIVPADSVLVAMYGATVGKSAINRHPCTTNQAVAFLTPDTTIAISKYVFYYILSIRRQLKEQAKGGAQPNISQSVLKAQLLPIPPLETQRRIVARIDELFSELDDGETALARAREDLEVYRKALLKAAVTGELTADWRAANPPKETGEQLLKRILAERKSSLRSNRQTIREIEDAHLWGIPKTWAWCRTDVAGFVQLGRQRTPKDHVGPDMRPYLRVANVFEDRICTADVKQMNFSDKEFEIYKLHKGDILLNEGQSLELIGRPAMFRGEVENCCFQNTLVRFQAARGVNPEFALLTFLDAMHRGRFRRIAKITTNIAHLGAARFSGLGFPLPPEEEQSEIVRLYREHVDDLRGMVDTLQTTPSLRQSILTAAFKGELVQ